MKEAQNRRVFAEKRPESLDKAQERVYTQTQLNKA